MNEARLTKLKRIAEKVRRRGADQVAISARDFCDLVDAAEQKHFADVIEQLQWEKQYGPYVLAGEAVADVEIEEPTKLDEEGESERSANDAGD